MTETTISKNAAILLLVFLPTIIAYFFGYGDPRTSINFVTAPIVYNIFKYIVYLSALLYLVFPLQLRLMRSDLLVVVLTLICFVFLLNIPSSSEGNNIIVRSLLKNLLLISILILIRSSRNFTNSNIKFLFYFFIVGFIVQNIGATVFGIFPSHTFLSESGYVFRYNGITNDSLSTAILLPAFVPLAFNHRYNWIFVPALMICGLATGSAFGAIIVPLTLFIYAIYIKRYKFSCFLLLIIFIGIWLAFDQIILRYQYKMISAVVHLKYFLNLLGIDYGQAAADCSVEFCESFIESMMYLSPVVLVIFYVLILGSIIQIIKLAKKSLDVIFEDSVLCLGFSIVMASFVHPVPIIPYVLVIYIFSVFLVKWKSYHLERRLTQSYETHELVTH